jgi:type III restriction enzyme
MKPFFITKKSEPEELLMALLDSSNKVEWWYKNRESEKKYLAIPYKDENNKEWAFYVDFIVKFKDGSIGLFDTKSGMTAKDAGPKAEALQAYIKEQNKKNKTLWGGIAIPRGESFVLNDKEKYTYNPNDFSSWKVLEI